ncbi:helix-turn-helix domain-containing protein [Anaerobranca gottschalkii]|uniref:Regulatory protein, luxR family n=1 Tax=Anaerobranca gottschalkii DSM 13577 TaxID=1120990 RepID=A0A1I0CFC3_9FIRM|nr:LuxR C-terminal-related transcriptional regulator [Anaerobranca gottschalkii]SET18301.1 regulatory protein, luxR family [Anaerobranca gottschalkii DSM 13577]
MKLLIIGNSNIQGLTKEILQYLSTKHELVFNDLDSYQSSRDIILVTDNLKGDSIKKLSKDNHIILRENISKDYQNSTNIIILLPRLNVNLYTNNPKILQIVIEILSYYVNKLQITNKNIELLSKKENEVLNLLLQGLNDQEISNKLFISDKTVRNHISNMLGKLGLKNRTQLVLWALQYLGKIKEDIK